MPGVTAEVRYGVISCLEWNQHYSRPIIFQISEAVVRWTSVSIEAIVQAAGTLGLPRPVPSLRGSARFVVGLARLASQSFG
jgi:hypothetical protein